MRGQSHFGARLAVTVVLLLMAAPAPALAAPPPVTTTADSSTPGAGSLREAIAGAAAGETVSVPAGHYHVTLGEIPVGAPITIQGAGASSTTVDAGGASRVFHPGAGVGSGTVTFRNLTITGGADTAQPGGGGILVDSGKLALDGVTMTGDSVNLGAGAGSGGGAVYSKGSGTTVTGSTFTLDTATINDAATPDHGGAAIFQQGVGPIGISSSTISDNTTTILAGACCNGGAVYQNANQPITVSNSHLDQNHMVATDPQPEGPSNHTCCTGGAAVYNHGAGAAPATVTNSTLNGNHADVTDFGCCDGGGAIYIDTTSPMTLSGSTLNGNETTVHGAACCNGGGAISTFTGTQFTASTLELNSATVTDDNCCDGGGAVLIDTGGPASDSSLTGVEMSHNATSVNSTGPMKPGSKNSCCNGGGALNYDTAFGLLTVSGSDVSANGATLNSTIDSGGGGIYDHGSGLRSLNSTLSGNGLHLTAAGTDGGGALLLDADSVSATANHSFMSFATVFANAGDAGTGGGVAVRNGSLSTKASIVTANTAAAGPDCGGIAATFTSAGYNIGTAGNGCGFTGTGDQSVAGSAFRLGPLGDNGGPTLTQALMLGSPAIDAIPGSACTDQATPTPTAVSTDQRGVPRPQPAGGSCDIGAFENGPADLALSGTVTPASVTVGQMATVQLGVTNAGPAPATATALTFTVPPGVSLVSESSSQGGCVAGACGLGVLNTGASAQVTAVVQPTKPGSFSIGAAVSSDEADATPADNRRSLTLIAKPPVTLKLSHVSQSHRSWHETSRLARLSRARRRRTTPAGTTFGFTLTERAAVTFAFTQRVAGRAAGRHHRCVAQTRFNRMRGRCTLTVTRGTLALTGRAGRNSLSFGGRLSRSRHLPLGPYKVTITAKVSRQRPAAAMLSFTIAAH